MSFYMLGVNQFLNAAYFNLFAVLCIGPWDLVPSHPCSFLGECSSDSIVRNFFITIEKGYFMTLHRLNYANVSKNTKYRNPQLS